MRDPSEVLAKAEIGVGGLYTRSGQIRADEFLKDLRGVKAIRKFREMRDNDSTIGAVMYATEQVLRDIEYKVEPANESAEAQAEADFVRSVLDDMDHTLDDHISEALSSLTYGFALFETVYKRRVGPNQKNPKKRSKHTDGRLGIRKLASRAQWTINRFDIDRETGENLGVYQMISNIGNDYSGYIPYNKLLHYKTTTTNDDPSGRSILRNAYSSYTYLTSLQQIEAIAVERELHGIPIGRMPADYLRSDASDEHKLLRQSFEKALRDLKFNEQGYLLLPSDLLLDGDGKATGGVGSRLMDVELITSNGTRNIDIDPIIKRYQHDIARSIMAEFLMLGSGSGSYALSKSKTDLFLRSVESYINSIFDVLNKQLVESLWSINGLNYDLMPRICAGDVAAWDLKEMGSYLRNLNGAGFDFTEDLDLVEELLDIAELPFDRATYEQKLADKKLEAKQQADAQMAGLMAKKPPNDQNKVK